MDPTIRMGISPCEVETVLAGKMGGFFAPVVFDVPSKNGAWLR
jgi:hypothetical protein